MASRSRTRPVKILGGLPWLLIGCSHSALSTIAINTAIATSTDDTLVTVTRIYDGDTIDVFQDGETSRVRLACIDSAETSQQPHGERATQTLSNLLSGQVRLNVVDTDRYGRLVAEVFTPSGDFVNLQMVEAGEPVVYQRYLDNCGDHASALLAAEQQAQTNGLGIWGDPNFIMPWDYRQGGADSETDVPSSTTARPDCVTTDCNCSDFDTWQQAQDVLNAYPGDPHRLDGDNDGEACESLR